MEYAHDLVNVSLGKKAQRPKAAREWEPFARKLATQLDGVHQYQRRKKKARQCRFDVTTFHNNPGAVSRFMKDLKKHQTAGNAEGFVSELNSICTTVQPRLVLNQQEQDVKISGKCSGTECSLTATTGGKTIEKEPRIKVPIRGYSKEAISDAVEEARSELRKALGTTEMPSGSISPEKKQTIFPRMTKPFPHSPTESPWGKKYRTEITINGFPTNTVAYIQAVPILEVLPSNNYQTFEPNPDYPNWLQPRDRERSANIQQVKSIAANLKPERLLTDYHTLDRGMPVVIQTSCDERESRYYVLSGNGRVMALQRASQPSPGNQDWFPWDAYLKDWDEGEWSDTVTVLGRGGYMLARVLDLKDRCNESDWTEEDKKVFREIAELGNVSAAIATSSTEQAMIDSAKMSAEFVGDLSPSEDENASIEQVIKMRANAGWVTKFMEHVPPTELAGLLDEQGRINESGVKRVVMALAVWTFGLENGPSIAFLTHESIDQDARTILQGTMRAVPTLALMQVRFQEYVTSTPPQLKKRRSSCTTR